VEWYKKGANEVFKNLDTSKNGLSEREAAKRLEKVGPNEIAKPSKAIPLIIFLRQFKSILIYILLAAVLISAFLGHWLDAEVIAIILILNAFLGFYQEYRAEKALEALEKLSAPHARVIRDGKEIGILAKDICDKRSSFRHT